MPGGIITYKKANSADGIYQDVPEVLWRTIESSVGIGSHDDPLGGWLLKEWRKGTGPDVRYHMPAGRFSREFKRSTTTMEHMLKLWEHWLRRKPGPESGPPFRLEGDVACHQLTNGSMTFGLWQYAIGGQAAQVMGSVTISEARYLPALDQVLWTGWNIMGTGSFMAGRLKTMIGLPEPHTLRRPGAFGATIHIIQWYSDVPSWVRAREQ